ncbi:MAG: NTP transferase domain-containing protein, partial [Bacteroidota bacterium]
SSRMTRDKAFIQYHKKPQYLHIYYMLTQVCKKVFVSVNLTQTEKLASHIPYIVDENNARGPFNGILSAHLKFPEVSWFVMACDLPFIDQFHIDQLVNKRDPNKAATTYCSYDDKIAPLIAIWEPGTLLKANEKIFFNNNFSVINFLKNEDVERVYPKDEKTMMNVNTLDQYSTAKHVLQNFP